MNLNSGVNNKYKIPGLPFLMYGCRLCRDQRKSEKIFRYHSHLKAEHEASWKWRKSSEIKHLCNIFFLKFNTTTRPFNYWDQVFNLCCSLTHVYHHKQDLHSDSQLNDVLHILLYYLACTSYVVHLNGGVVVEGSQYILCIRL